MVRTTAVATIVVAADETLSLVRRRLLPDGRYRLRDLSAC